MFSDHKSVCVLSVPGVPISLLHYPARSLHSDIHRGIHVMQVIIMQSILSEAAEQVEYDLIFKIGLFSSKNISFHGISLHY
jgi:hypothetical protein